MLFGLFTVAGSTLLTVVLCFALAIVLGMLFYRIDDKIERRREHALEIASWAEDEGFFFLAGILRAYAIGDYSKIWTEIKKAYQVFRDDDLRKAHLKKVSRRMLARALQDPERAEVVRQMVKDADAVEAAKKNVVATP